MDYITQKKVFSNNLLHRYIRENSYWYKMLNRNPMLIDKMVQEMKDKYKLNTGDKIERLQERLNFVESLLRVIE